MSQLMYHFGFKYRFYPSDQQKTVIKINSDQSRYYYNHLIANKRKLGWIIHTHYTHGITKLNVIKNYEKTLKPGEFRERHNFLNDDYLDGCMFGTTKQNNQRAYVNHWNGLQGQPNFHSKKAAPYVWKYQTSFISWETKHGRNQNIKFKDAKHLVLPKLGTITLGHDTQLYNQHYVRIGTVTVTKSADNKYYISGQLGSDYPFKKYLPETHKACGIDLNISNFLMTSDGKVVNNPRFYTKGLPHLKSLNQRVSRRRRYAVNNRIDLSVDKGYQRARIRHAEFETHIKNERRNFLENLSTKLIENQDLIVAEDLKSSNILRNHRIAQKASDCGWREFLSMLQQKAKMYGKTVILINPAYTTQKCASCGFVCTKSNGYHLILSDRAWICPHCGAVHVRDWNAANNILAEGVAQIFKQRRENLIKLKRTRTPQEFLSRPNLTFEFQRVKS